MAARVKNILKSKRPCPSKPVLIVVAAALTDDRGRVLVQQRPGGASLPGLWEFPGGKIEPGEVPEAALTRELREELGIEAEMFTPLAFASEALGDRHLLLLLYRCERWTGEPEALHASALQWLQPAALDNLPMPAADRPLIASLTSPA